MASNFYVLKYNIKRALDEPKDSSTASLSEQDRATLRQAQTECKYIDNFVYLYCIADMAFLVINLTRNY